MATTTSSLTDDLRADFAITDSEHLQLWSMRILRADGSLRRDMRLGDLSLALDHLRGTASARPLTVAELQASFARRWRTRS